MDSSLEAILGPDPNPLETLILDLIQTTKNKQRSQAESPPYFHNNNTHKLIHTMSSSSSINHQISEILGPDPELFKTLISPTMTPSNEQHSEAESLFNLCKQTNPKKLAEKLVQLIEHSPLLDVRAMSAILLPNTLLQKPSELRPSLWNSSFEVRLCVRSGLLNCVRNEQNKPIIIILGNTISKLTAGNLFPELKGFILYCFNLPWDWPRDWVCGCCCCFETVKWLKESALLIFTQLGEQYVKDYLVQRQTDLHGVFKDCLENGDIRITALSAVIKFINCLELSDRRSFKNLLPLMFRCVTQELNEATAQEALVLLIELARTKWTFFTYGGWPMFLGIAEAERFEEGTRHLVIEVVITTVEEKKCNLPEPDINSLCAILMRMLLNIEDEDEDAGRSSNYIFGKQCLHRLATALGGNTIVPVVYDYLSAPNDQWKNHLAGLVALAQIAKRLSKLVMIPNLEQLVTRVLNSIESHPDHPRVRWVAINAIGELCADLDPDLQSEYHRVIPALVKAMGEDRDSRVRLAAIKAAGQLLADLDPDLQFEYNSDVLLITLVEAMRKDPDQRVRLAAINEAGQLSADLDPKLRFQNHWRVLPTLTEAIREDPDQRVRVAAINEAGQLFADLDPKLRLENHLPVLPTLTEAIREDPDQRVRLAAINVTVQLFAGLDPNLPLTDEHHESVLYALHGAICDFNYLLVQDCAVNAMINISMNYPLVTPRYLRVTVGTLLELRRREDIALYQTRIRAIRDTLEAFEENLPRDTWTSTFNRLRPEQQAEFRSIREEDDES